MTNAPDRIWLQDGGDYDAARQANSDVTWCNAPVNDGDTEYLRTDLAQAQVAAALIRAAEMLKELGFVHESGETLAKEVLSLIEHPAQSALDRAIAQAVAERDAEIARLRDHIAILESRCLRYVAGRNDALNINSMRAKHLADTWLAADDARKVADDLRAALQETKP
jgi:hypothetical protein